jgi:hypothetical protein
VLLLFGIRPIAQIRKAGQIGLMWLNLLLPVQRINQGADDSSLVPLPENGKPVSKSSRASALHEAAGAFSER